MKAVFNTRYKNAGTMVCVDDLSGRLKQAGHSVGFNDWNHYTDYDVAFFMAPDSDVRTAKRMNPRLLAGIMDPKLYTKRQRREAREADFLCVGSIEQRDIFLKYNKNIFIYYMFPEVEEKEKVHEEKKKIIIGYHGNKLHLHCMEHLTAALDELASRYEIEFHAVYNIKKLGKWSLNLPRVCPVKHIQWSREGYGDHIGAFDIGVAPAAIPIHENIAKITSRYLSSFFPNWMGYYATDYLLRFKYSTNPGRVYVFSQLGVPVVADFLPSYCQVIQDGHSGFLVYSKEGWYNALEKLILSHNLRNTLSRNLKEFLDRDYSPEATFRKFLSFVDTLQ
jgi:hypothetical protein